MKDRPPDGHFPRAVRDDLIITGDDFLYPRAWKYSAVAPGKGGQIRKPGTESRSHRPIPGSIGSMTRCAMRTKQIGSVQRGNQTSVVRLSPGFRGRFLRFGS